MGYYTDHTLTVRKVKNEEEFNKLNEYLKEKEIINYAIQEGDYDPNHQEAIFYPYDSVKWYDHSEAMVGVAEKFPKMYFELEGAGEEFGDFWKEYYHDMDIEYCRGEIVYEQPKKVAWQDLLVI